MNFTDEEKMAYEDHLKWLRIEANTLEKARREAKEEGIQIGQEKGKLEGKLEIARSMIKNSYDLEDTILLTGLSRSDGCPEPCVEV